MAVVQFPHEPILKGIREAIENESRFAPYSDSALKGILEDQQISVGTSQQIYWVRTSNDIPNRCTRLWLYRHDDKKTT